MTQQTHSILKACFHILCLCVTVYLTHHCVKDYLRNEDVTQIEYRRFHQNEQLVYPSITYCFANPIMGGHKIWGKYSLDSNQPVRDYKDFIRGKNTQEFSDIDYDEVTMKLEDYLIQIEVKLENAANLYYGVRNGQLNLTFVQDELWQNLDEEKENIPELNHYISHRSFNKKCHTFDVPYISKGKLKKEKITRIRLMINPIMVRYSLPNHPKDGPLKPTLFETIPTLRKAATFSMHYHYPHQMLKALSTGSGFKPSIESADYYARKYYLANIEVLRRRHKPERPCIENEMMKNYDERGHEVMRYIEKGYDEKILQRTIAKVGCKPPTVKLGGPIPFCNQTKYSEFQKALTNDSFHPPPCDSIQSMSEWHGEEDQTYWRNNKNWNESKLIHEIYFEDVIFKEIQYLKKYTEDSLMGNVGGIIGNIEILINDMFFKIFNISFKSCNLIFV